MNVVIVGSRSFDSLEFHLHDSLTTLGHNARIVDVTDVVPVSRLVAYWTARFVEPVDRLIGRRLAIRIATYQPALVIVVYRHLHPVLVETIKEHLAEVIVIQINPDALTNLEKGQIIAAGFDAYFSKEPYIVDCLRNKAGLNAYYLPEAFNPRFHRRPSLPKAEAERHARIDVLIYGNLYAYRARLIEQLLRAGIHVAVYGTEGPYLSPAVRSVFRSQYLDGALKNQLLYGAKIVLNTLHYAEITSVNQKYFEINGIGAFRLCDNKPTIREYSAVRPSRVTYRTMAEAIDKIRYYLDRPAERYELADRQYHHFQQHHTFDQRMNQLIHIIGLSPLSVYERHDV